MMTDVLVIGAGQAGGSDGKPQIETSMRMIVCHQYGSPDVLELTEVEKPIPKENKVLLKVHAASVNPADWHLRRSKPYKTGQMGVPLIKIGPAGMVGFDRQRIDRALAARQS